MSLAPVTRPAPSIPKVFLRDRLYLHKSLLTEKVRRRFTTVLRDFYPEYNEETGELNETRDLVVHGWKKYKDDIYSISRGDLDAIWEEFSGHCEIVDQRSVVPLTWPLRWKNVLMKDGSRSPLRDTQRKFISDLLGFGYGIGEAPPRFGKTICMSAITCKVGMRALLIVHQIELAKQFVAKFRRCTNVDAAEAHYGKQLIGICTKWEDFDNFDICVTTWQRFHAVLPNTTPEDLSEYEDPALRTLQLEKLHAMQTLRYEATQRHIARLRNRFGLVMVDEVHRAASPCFSAVVDKFNPWYRLGVTATPDRKDRMDVVIKFIAGPTVTVGTEDKVELRVKHVYTGFNPKFKNWTTYENAIAKDKRRNKMAMDLIEADVKAGHHVVAVCTRTQHILDLIEMAKARGLEATGFHGKLSPKMREQAMADAESGKAKIVFAMRSMLLGIDIPLWSAMHVLVPSANPPNFYQEISRVRTPRPGKDFALIRDYLDACSASNGCYRYRHGVYVDPVKAPILFEDETGAVVPRLALERILTVAAQTRQAGGRAATAESNELLGFGGATGPRMPKFDDSTWADMSSM